MSKGGRRWEYLSALGLQHDPFLSPVAEQELNRVKTLEKFLEYFIMPMIQIDAQPADQLALEKLRTDRHVIVFGQPGAGKTTLRLALEAEYRRMFEKVLVVTLELSEPQAASQAQKDQFEQLAEALAIDLFVQVCERYNPLADKPSPEQLAALKRQIAFSGQGRVIDKMLDEPVDEMPFGIAAHWSMIGKRAIRYIPPAKELLKLLAEIQSSDENDYRPVGRQFLEESLQASRLWGFSEVVVLVDTVDQFDPAPEFMLDLIKPLLQGVDFWEQQNLLFKYFLPEDMKSHVHRFLKEARLRRYFVDATIIWDVENLLQLIQRRFEAAGSRHTQLGAFSGEEAATRLDQFILADAASPRDVLERINFFVQKISRHKQPASVDFEIKDIEFIEQEMARKHQADLPNKL
jgi:hypothetical protein